MVLQINERWFTAINSLAGKNSVQYYIIPLLLIYLWFQKIKSNGDKISHFF